MNMMSNFDVTNSAHQIQMTIICHWMKPPHENFLRSPLSGLLLNIKVCCLRTWKRGELFLFILNTHTRCRRVHIAALIKTAQQSGNTSGKVAFNLSTFFPGVSSFEALANEVTIVQNMFLCATHLLHCILFILTLGNKLIFCIDTQISSPHISHILTNNVLPLCITLPAPFLVLFSSDDKKLI